MNCIAVNDHHIQKFIILSFAHKKNVVLTQCFSSLKFLQKNYQVTDFNDTESASFCAVLLDELRNNYTGPLINKL